MDIDGAGGAATGGLIAGAIEKPTGQAGDEPSGVCSDCGAPVSGRFCAECGQPTHVHRTLLHLCEEVLHGVMHFDARIWRTLPLLAFNPGRLTREWVQGRRTRYVSPLALFLFTIFLIFFLLSFAGPGELVQIEPLPARIAVAEAAVTSDREDLARAEAALAQAGAGDAEAQAARDEAAGDLATAEENLAELRAKQTAGPRPDGLTPGSWQAELKDLTGSDATASGEGWNQHVFKKLQNPDFAFYKLQQTAYKFAFLLVPLSIPFVALLFLWRRGATLYDHGVFVLYSLTFMAILLLLLALLVRISEPLGGLAVFAAVFGVPVHMFAQLKGAYGLSIFSAAWRTAMLFLFCSIALTLFIIAILYLGLGA